MRRLAGGSLAVLHSRAWVISCLALAILLRVAWIVTVESVPFSDPAWYWEAAQRLADGQGFTFNGRPTAYWPVGYPAFLAPLTALPGDDLVAARVGNLVLSIAALIGIMILAARLFQSTSVGRLTLLAGAIYPGEISYCSLLLSEQLFVCLLIWGTLACLWAGGAVRVTLLSGLLLGLATLVRPVALMVPALVLTCTAGKPSRGWVRTLGLLYVGVAFVVVPWGLRNWYEFRSFVPVSNNGGVNLYIGNSPWATGRYEFGTQQRAGLLGDPDRQWRGGPEEVRVDRRASALARSHMKANPGAVIRLWPAKLRSLYAAEDVGLYFNSRVTGAGKRLLEAWGRPTRVAYWCLWLLGLTGLYLSLTVKLARRPRVLVGGVFFILLAGFYPSPLTLALAPLVILASLWSPTSAATPILPVAMMVYFTLLPMLFFGSSRFHFPVIAWIAMYAAYFVAAPLEWQRRARGADGH